MEARNDDFSIRDDQRNAMEELERIQSTDPTDWSDETDAYYHQLLMEPPPDYEETRARLEELNARLRSEPSPPPSPPKQDEDDKEEGRADGRPRRPRIRFREDLTQVAPSPPGSPPAGEFDDDGTDISEAALTTKDAETDEDRTNDGKEGRSSGSGRSERGSPEGDASGRNAPEGKRKEQSRDNDDDVSVSSGFPYNNRSSSANAVVWSPRLWGPFQSKDSEAAFWAWRQGKSRQADDEHRRKSARSRREAEEAGTKQREREASLLGFEAWRAQRDEQLDEERRLERRQRQAQEEKRQREAEDQRARQPTMEAWLAGKRRQASLERRYCRAEREEAETLSARDARTPEQCGRAYRRWLRRKEEQRRQEAHELHQRMRAAGLAMRRTRRSQELASALSAASSYRYMDYYGYR